MAACKQPSKSAGAFDAFDRSQAENQVFGSDSNEGLHFDATIAERTGSSTDNFIAWVNDCCK